MSTATDHTYAAGWYEDPDDPAGLRYFDGRQWTEHRSAVPPETPDERAVSPVRRAERRLQLTAHGATIAACLLLVVLLLGAGGIATLGARKPGAVHLEMGQTLDALPATADVADATGMALSNAKREDGDYVGSSGDTEGCSLGTSTKPAGFQNGANFEASSGLGGVEITVFTFDDDQHAADAFKDVQRRWERLKVCFSQLTKSSSEQFDTGAAGDGYFFLSNDSSNNHSYAGAMVPSGNVYVSVRIDKPSGPLSADQITHVADLALDAARQPDPARR